jgi:cold shock CspA family protein
VTTGEVVEFDAAAGYGSVRADDGHAFFFHCTAIADGTRTIDVGAPVAFEVVPGRRGQWEAAGLKPAQPPTG